MSANKIVLNISAPVSSVQQQTIVPPESAKKMARKDKEFLWELDSQVKDIRTQLNEQLRCLDYRMETQISVVGELQDFFRRRAEVELDYSKNLDKLSKSLSARHKEQKQKREQWHLFSSYASWQHLVAQTKRQARDHALLSDIYANTVIQRLGQVTEEVQRIYRRCREVGYESHEELLKVLHELHAAMKTSQMYQLEQRQAETKLRYVEAQRQKLESSIAREKLEKSKKFKLIEKEIAKRRAKFNDAHLKALKARNEYVLCMDAANSAVHKYFIDDLSDIIDCMDIGFHNCVGRALQVHVSAEENIRRSLQISVDGMNKCLSNLDSRADKQRFLEANHAAFMIPKKFDAATYQNKIDEGGFELMMVPQVREEFESRYLQLHKRLTSLRAESEEVWKTLETAESSLMEMISAKDYDVTPYFTVAAAIDDDKFPPSTAPLKQPEAALLKLRADRQETEDFYLNKFHEYILKSNLMHRLQAKYELIHKALAQDGSQLPTSPKLASLSAVATTPNPLGGKPRRRRIGRTPLIGQPKLFGGSLEEYLEATNEEIPLVMKSCIRVINLYGLHHQGIYRVSGSQVEINNFRESFERGEDPLADVTDASDINSVAGVFKLYLRELREPLFPILFFDQFMELAQLASKEDFKTRMREVVQTLPRPVFVVMRYLFSFLNHLSEYSDENMMDPYNLAICFGPTLVPVPEDKDQVQYQNLVNELIKNIIINAEDIFPNDGGLVYERYISREPDEGEVGEAPSDTMSEEVDSEVYPSEDDSVFREKDISLQLFGKAETLEAIAQFDFTARSQRELSFKKGDLLTLYTQVSSDWWKGTKDGRDGLVPDKYIMLRIRDEDRERLEIGKLSTTSGSSSSEESAAAARRRTSSSSDASASSARLSKVRHDSRVLTGSESIESESPAPSLPSPSLEKRVRTGPTVALVRPTTLSCQGPALHPPPSPKLSTSSQSSVTIVCNSNGSSTVVCPIVTTTAVLESVAKESVPAVATAMEGAVVADPVVPSVRRMEQAANEVLINATPVTHLDDSGDRDSLAESLTLSDEKSLCDSFTSLDTLDQEMDPELSVPVEKVRPEPSNQAGSLQNLESTLEAENVPVFRRQRWETRSMTNLERSSGPEKPNISVGGWSVAKTTEGATAANDLGPISGPTKGSFVRKRDLWEKRTSITSTSTASVASPVIPSQPQRPKHTPDLVMDLPPSLPLSSSPKEGETLVDPATRQRHESESSSSSSNSSSPSSPDMTTAAETFAMQNQSTLKKSTIKQIKKDRADAAVASASAAPTEPTAAVMAVEITETPPRPSVKVSVSTYGSASPISTGIRPITPKIANRFPHSINLYATPMPVLPVAFAAEANVASAMSPGSVDAIRPQLKIKPQVLKKPTLPVSLSSPESSRRSGFDQDSHL
ncbi:SLIT-ROBO Rho GTPase-activating protein 1-like isoform X3 [Daphnia carinata]|uniref:SLIT-ROBO Rho GTPase-activating protein 1-like isoform X3 n=1 Tax=Daphnia carinata TaxID=120202 RepID=UPI0028684B8E|nr:SLIT-ROBO Rho GTPase-activating protein 1-like isoform X3 [Daphnia carinata]